MAVLKADSQEQRKALYIVAVFFILGFIIIMWGVPLFVAYVKQKPHQEALQILCTTLSICFLSVLPIAAIIYRYGHRILKAGQSPIPSAQVFRDTEIVTGEAAQRRGRILIGISIFLALASLLGAFTAYRLYKSFDDHKTKPKDGESFKIKAEETVIQNVKEIALQKMNKSLNKINTADRNAQRLISDVKQTFQTKSSKHFIQQNYC